MPPVSTPGRAMRRRNLRGKAGATVNGPVPEQVPKWEVEERTTPVTSLPHRNRQLSWVARCSPVNANLF